MKDIHFHLPNERLEGLESFATVLPLTVNAKKLRNKSLTGF